MPPYVAALTLSLASLAQSITLHRREYYWPEPRGRAESYGTSPYTAPRELSEQTLAWSWFNGGPFGRYSSATNSGVLIDDSKDIYLSSTDGIRKFSSSGDLIWFADLETSRIPSLSDGRLYVTDNDGTAYALSMATGQLLWSAPFTTELGRDISGIAVFQGVLIGEADGSAEGGAQKVVGLNITDGSQLWEFYTDSQLWNMMPLDTGMGSFVFQDRVGGVYHLRTSDGEQLWRSGYNLLDSEDFTDGLAMVKDGLVFAVHAEGPCCNPNQPASLHAYDLDSGELVWGRNFSHPVNSQVVVGHLGQGSGLSDVLAVVVPVGAQPGGRFDAYESSIAAYDAKTGEPLWEYTFPTYSGDFAAGDLQRLTHGTLCMPNPYGSPSIDARGTVYTGHFNGMVYAIRDDDGDGQIQSVEVSQYETGAGFRHGGAAIAPGMLVIPSCDGLFVFAE